MPQQREKKHSFKVTSDMKKLRDVPTRFFNNKKFMIEKFKAFGIDDEHNWSQSQGEGITYERLLKLPFYDDTNALPENAVKDGTEIVYKEKPLDWDGYFKAIQDNFQVGFTSKFKHSKKNKDKQSHNPAHESHKEQELYNDSNIEWDEIQQTSGDAPNKKQTPKKYKMTFKQISENEKTEIIKTIENEEHRSF